MQEIKTFDFNFEKTRSILSGVLRAKGKDPENKAQYFVSINDGWISAWDGKRIHCGEFDYLNNGLYQVCVNGSLYTFIQISTYSFVHKNVNAKYKLEGVEKRVAVSLIAKKLNTYVNPKCVSDAFGNKDVATIYYHKKANFYAKPSKYPVVIHNGLWFSTIFPESV